MAKKTARSRQSKSGSSYLTVYCAACREPVLLYQKDGPGGLLRAYLDRILAPENLAALCATCDTKSDVPNLVCPACGSVLGVPMVHGSGDRLAFRLVRGRFVKRKTARVFPPQND
ncbi:MAG: hypothetical protein JW966_05590 [Anaerolineae bacterium]|nr:hypothetical protein [Anaerolineae bacterium]